jgi:hypothetical protein
MRFLGFSGYGESHPTISSSEMPAYCDFWIHPNSEKVVNFQNWRNRRHTTSTVSVLYEELPVSRPPRPRINLNISSSAVNPPSYNVVVIDLPTYDEAAASENTNNSR